MRQKRIAVIKFAVILFGIAFAVLAFNWKTSAREGGPEQYAAGHSFFNNAPARSEQQQGDAPVEQKHPNVQALKGLPESQLIPVMQFMSASLGVNCAYCHVNTDGKWEFEKDDKKTKLAARRMIQMTLDINKGNRDVLGGAGVSCFTCHRGSTDPVNIPQLPLPPAGEGGAAGAPKPPSTLPTAAQVVEKYLQAIGGQTAAERLKNRVMKGTLIGADGKAIPFEVHLQTPGKLLAIIGDPKQGATMQALNGSTGWMKTPKEQRELRPNEVARLRANAQAYDPVQIREAAANMRVGRGKVGDRDAYVLTSQVDDAHTRRFYFDAQTGLLLRVTTYTSTLLGRIPSQTDYEDYREVEGVKLPFTVRMSSVDARSDATRKFTEIKANVAADDAQFNPPPASTTPPAQK